MTIKTCKTAVRASTLLAAFALSGGAFAAAAVGDSYTFDTNAALGSGTYSALNGNGTVVADAYSYTSLAGKPLSSSNDNVLEIAGTVTYTNAGDSAANTSSQVDFMFKVEATDELENPDGSDIQVALAVGTNDVGTLYAPIKLWCKKTDGGAAEWVTLKQNAVTGSWIRATLVLDYSSTPKRCKVSLDGNPVLNPAVTASAVDSEWFYFAGGVSSTFVKSISMVGSTRVDDLKVSYEALSSYTPIPANTTIAEAGQPGSNITYDYINKYGVTVEEATSLTPLNATSGMTVAQKFEAGLDPKSDTKFELQTMTVASATAATVKFPGNNAAANYDVIVSANKDATTTDSGIGVAISNVDGAQTGAGEQIKKAELTLPADAGLLYIKLKTK